VRITAYRSLIQEEDSGAYSIRLFHCFWEGLCEVLFNLPWILFIGFIHWSLCA